MMGTSYKYHRQVSALYFFLFIYCHVGAYGWLSQADSQQSCHFTLREVSSAKIWGQGVEFFSDTFSSMGKIRMYS